MSSRQSFFLSVDTPQVSYTGQPNLSENTACPSSKRQSLKQVSYTGQPNLSEITACPSSKRQSLRQGGCTDQPDLSERTALPCFSQRRRSSLKHGYSTVAPPCHSGNFAKKVDIQDYRFIRKLGEGGFGRVLFAQQKQDQKFYAVKALSKNRLVAEKMVGCIELEKQLMADLDHPFIINLIGYSKDDALLYLIMECCNGGDLYTLLRKAQCNGSDLGFPKQQAIFYAAQLVVTLAYLSDKNVIHRDLKPDNLLLCPNGYIKLCDFGLAKKLQPGKRAFTWCGTPNYMAPEILLNKGQSVAVDWWGLGIIIFEMLTGKTPWNDKDDTVLYQNIIEGCIYFPRGFDKNAKALLKRLCVADLSIRYGNLKDESDDIVNDPWFSEIDWQDLQNQRIRAPFTPNIVNESDTSNFEVSDSIVSTRSNRTMKDVPACFGEQLRKSPGVTGSQDPFADW